MTATGPHVAYRIDGYPPAAPHERRLYRCRDGCEYLTGPELAASNIPHEVPDTAALIREQYHGAGVVITADSPSQPPGESPAA